jgi:peptide/nickel transport system substrate-binding protein
LPGLHALTNPTGPIVILQRQSAFQDPHDCTDRADVLALFEAVFDAPVRRDIEGRFQPALAERWDVSTDAWTWTFHLRPGLTFHNGAPVDADVMVKMIQRMQRPDIGATLGAPAVWGQYLGGATVAASSALTFVITLQEPIADLLDILCSAYALPPEFADTPGFLEAPIGSGAYQVDAIEDGEIAMSANPNWYGGNVPNAELLWRTVTDPTERANAVANGKAHVATRLSQAPAHIDYLDPVAIIYLLNVAKGALTDARVRSALALAVDRGALVRDVLGGTGQPLLGFLSPNHVGADPAPQPMYDPDEARRLLGAAGFAEGLAITIDCPTSLPDEAEALTAAVIQHLAAVSVTATVRLHEDRTAYAEMVRAKGIGDMCVFDSSPMSAFRVLFEKIDSRNGGAWHQGYANAEIEALIDQARSTTDPAARERLHHRCYQLLQADPAWLTLYNHVRSAALAGEHDDWRMRADGVLDVTTLPKF